MGAPARPAGFKMVSNLFPAVTYDRHAFFRADGASEEVLPPVVPPATQVQRYDH